MTFEVVKDPLFTLANTSESELKQVERMIESKINVGIWWKGYPSLSRKGREGERKICGVVWPTLHQLTSLVAKRSRKIF